MLKQLVRSAAIAALGTILLSCSKSPDSKSTQQENALHIAVGASPQSLDPHVVTGVPAMHILSALGERLVRLDPVAFTIHPAAAEHWQISDDGKRYTFKLRQDARWSNGEPVTAADFVFTWQRALMPMVAWQYASDYYFIKGAEDLFTGKTTDPTHLGVRAIDTHTLVFELTKPNPLFLKLLSSEKMMPVHQATLRQFGEIDDVTTAWTRANHFVSNGPFTLTKWDINKVIELSKNPHYHSKDTVSLEKIYAYPIETETAEERAFRSGQIQVSYGGRLPAAKIANYQQKHPENLHIQKDYATYFYLFNTSRPPFNDVRVRQALAHAIDREAIVKHITKAGEPPANTLNPHTPNYSENVIAPTFDLNKAKQLLAEAGYPNGEGFPAFSILYNTADTHRKVALAIQQMWKTHLGIQVGMDNQEWKVYLDTRQNHQYDVARAGSVSAIGDPFDFLKMFQTGHGMNDSAWSSADYDQLIQKAINSPNNTERLAHLAQAESLLLQEMPFIPLYYYTSAYLIDTKVKGLQFNPLKRIRYDTISIDTEQ